jgi:biopolymer transport protein ExbB
MKAAKCSAGLAASLFATTGIATPAWAAELGAVMPRDLSPVAMFLSADPLVKAVMIGLAIASILTWTVLLAKTRELALARSAHNAALAALDGATGLEDARKRLGARPGAATMLFQAAIAELRLSDDALHDVEGVKERVASRLESETARQARRALSGTGLLATIGATAPFVGLFGTVWGLMKSFVGIARSQTTNLAVVAPGIAEALLATALGLIAAIPAVVIYNHLARAIATHKAALYDIAGAIQRLVSRDLSRGALSQVMAAPDTILSAAE